MSMPLTKPRPMGYRPVSLNWSTAEELEKLQDSKPCCHGGNGLFSSSEAKVNLPNGFMGPFYKNPVCGL